MIRVPECRQEDRIRSRIIVGAFLLFGLLAAGTIATSGDGVAPPRQWAITNFIDPVLVADQILMGPYLIVHDDTKMARQTTIAGSRENAARDDAGFPAVAARTAARAAQDRRNGPVV